MKARSARHFATQDGSMGAAWAGAAASASPIARTARNRWIISRLPPLISATNAGLDGFHSGRVGPPPALVGAPTRSTFSTPGHLPMIRFEGGSMAYVDTNLLPGETVIYRSRIHWIALAPCLVTGAILDILACVFLVAAFAWHGPKGMFTIPLAVIAAVLAVAGSAWVTLWFMQRNATEIAVTN